MAQKLPVPERLPFAEVKELFEADYPVSYFRVVQGGVDASVTQGKIGDPYRRQPLKDVPPPKEVEMLLAKAGWFCATTDWGRLWSPREW